MQYKLEITKKLEDLGDKLDRDDFVAILNLPDANLCEKRAELVVSDNGELEQSCKGCVTQGILRGNMLSMDEIKEAIDYFARNYGTQFITINGRGDPFHPNLKERTLEKIGHAAELGIQSYVFTAGGNLDEQVCTDLADNRVNVMMSLFGNRFIDADFFEGKSYSTSTGRIQNQSLIAENLRRLIRTYREHADQPFGEGVTRLGMNYVVSESDLAGDAERVKKLREAAHKNGIVFIASTNFEPHPDASTQMAIASFVREHTDTVYSTGVGGQCQMGAGSSVTMDFNGQLYRCPYMNGRGDGNFLKLPDGKKEEVVRGYLRSRGYACVVRRILMDR